MLVVVADGAEKLACVLLWAQHKSLVIFGDRQGSFVRASLIESSFFIFCVKEVKHLK